MKDSCLLFYHFHLIQFGDSSGSMLFVESILTVPHDSLQLETEYAPSILRMGRRAMIQHIQHTSYVWTLPVTNTVYTNRCNV